ncbi:MAG: hypothetical protein Q9213_003731 [Squamulea squamosa]
MSGPAGLVETKPAIHINKLKTGDSIYLGTDAEGGLLFRQNLCIGPRAERQELASNCLIALGLTEVCYQEGKGKVYFLPLPERDHYEQDIALSVDQSAAAFEKEYWKWYTLPNLVYDPLFIWDDGYKAVWDWLRQTDRLTMLNARAGGLSKKDKVLLVETIYDGNKKDTFKIDGLIGAPAGGEAAVLAIVPRAYLGWYAELRSATATGWGSNEFQDGYHAIDHTVIADKQVADAKQVIDKLREMYFSSTPGAVVEYGEVIHAIVSIHNHAEERARGD